MKTARKFTTISVPVDLSAEMRKQAIDDRLGMTEFIRRCLEAYKEKIKGDGLDFIDADLKEMKQKPKPKPKPKPKTVNKKQTQKKGDHK